MKHHAFQRLLALRAMEQERAEADLATQRRLEELCRAAYAASVERTEAASQALHRALAQGDRESAIVAELALIVGPLERRALHPRLALAERNAARAAVAWRGARTRREQMQTVAKGEQARLALEAQRREQKSLDDWYRTSQLRCEATGVHEDQNFPRNGLPCAEHDGMPHAQEGAE